MFFLGVAEREPSRIALIDSIRDRRITYGELTRMVGIFSGHLSGLAPAKSLIFCFCRNRVETVTAYLGAIESGHTIALLDEDLAAEFKIRLIRIYEPEFVLTTRPSSEYENIFGNLYTADERTPINGLNVLIRRKPGTHTIHPDSALLLSTSGSTGTPKFVRLTRRNIESNAASICEALAINAEERPITSLPVHYSYGLSVLNSHLAAGATIVLTDESITSGAFWGIVREHECTSVAGVPYSYQILQRIDIDALNIPSLRIMTQAGGKLSPERVMFFRDKMACRGGKFFVMYGSTEATARMAILPFDDLPRKAGSAGKAIPGGEIGIETASGLVTTEADVTGQIVYRGPNVMMGYAENRDDLALGDINEGVLKTGDVGYLDSEGFLHITGRANRDAKILGLRLNVDEIEQLLYVNGPTAVIERKEKLIVFCEYGEPSRYSDLARDLSARLNLHVSVFQFRHIAQLPLGANGKVDYRRLQELSE